jgi:hypothetical protein
MKSLSYAIAICTLFTSAHIALGRQWTDSSGQYHVDGEFVYLVQGRVWLSCSNSAMRSCLLENLCKKDQEFVEQTIAGRPGQTSRGKPESSRAAPEQVQDRSGVDHRADAASASRRTVESGRGVAAGTTPYKIIPSVKTSDTKVHTVTLQASTPSSFRYVYFGQRGTYHLTSTIGTEHYFFCCESTLVGSSFDHMDYSFLYYRVTEHGLEDELWAFALAPSGCGCYYAVWRKADYDRNGTLEWRSVDYAQRVTPRLPQD